MQIRFLWLSCTGAVPVEPAVKSGMPGFTLSEKIQCHEYENARKCVESLSRSNSPARRIFEKIYIREHCYIRFLELIGTSEKGAGLYLSEAFDPTFQYVAWYNQAV